MTLKTIEWEELEHLHSYTQSGWTKRLKVPGGWIVNTYSVMDSIDDSASSVSESTCFYPDPSHEWLK